LLVRGPQQRRSEQTRAAIVTAAAKLAEDGAETLSVAQIAAAAGVSNGALYQYFEGLDAVIDAVIDSHLVAFENLITTCFATHTFGDATTAVAVVIDAYIRYYRTTPGFHALWFGPTFTPRRRALEQAANGKLANTMYRELITARLIRRSAAAQKITAANWEIADTLLRHAFRDNPTGDQLVLKHLKKALSIATNG
jgi:AcrR family transcriptional regulator